MVMQEFLRYFVRFHQRLMSVILPHNSSKILIKECQNSKCVNKLKRVVLKSPNIYKYHKFLSYNKILIPQLWRFIK
jgi:hypothetical protein